MDLHLRVDYLKFRRLIWLAECLLTVLLLIVEFLLNASREVLIFTIWFCIWRVLTEVINYLAMAEQFHMEDRWRLLWLLY